MGLQKIQRLMMDGAWTDRVQAACHLTDTPYDQAVLTTMTQRFADDIEYDPATYEITIPNLDDALIQAVEEWSPPPPSGPETMSDSEIMEQITLLRAEQNRRADLVRVLQTEPALATAYQTTVLDREPGAPWTQPLGAFDAYQEGQIVTHKGAEWESLISNNVWEPGTSIAYWRDLTPTSPEPVPWVEQQWPAGSLVIHEGHVWLAIQDVLAPNWAPGPTTSAYWEDQGPHHPDAE